MVSIDESRKFLDPGTVALIANYRLVARLIVEGFFMGLHAGPRHAFSMEYSKHREYYPGDSLRLVDWKIFGKTDRFYVKQFEEETNLQAWLLLDISKSMSYQGETAAISKIRYASCLAAAMAYLLLDQRDLVGLILFDDRLRKMIYPSSAGKQLDILLKELSRIQEGPGSSFEDAACLAASRIKKRGLIILFSDLLGTPDRIERTLKHYLHKGNELIVFHILSPEELKFPFTKFGFFKDLETSEKVLLQPEFLRNEYLRHMENYLKTVKNLCGRLRVSYQLVETTSPFDRALTLFLESRRKISR
jgi:uncharacterized protein (DUF58 family)